MSTPVIMDAVAVGAVALLALIGAWRGLWKTLAGILAFALALLGAGLIASHFAAPLTERLVPVIMERVSQRVQEEIQSRIDAGTSAALQEAGLTSDSTDGTADSAGSASASTGTAPESDDALSSALTGLNLGGLELSSLPGLEALQQLVGANNSVPMGMLPSLLERVGLTQDLREELLGRVRDKLSDLGQSTADSALVAMEQVLTELLRPMIYSVLYGVSFFVLSLVLNFALGAVGRSMAGIPVLNAVNRAGGLILGLGEGLLLLIIASWLIRVAGLDVEMPPLSDTVVLRFLAEHSVMDLFTLIQPKG